MSFLTSSFLASNSTWRKSFWTTSSNGMAWRCWITTASLTEREWTQSLESGHVWYKITILTFLYFRNPMCSVFPYVTLCNIPNVEAAGGEQVHNGLCVLTQVKNRSQKIIRHQLSFFKNIINEKIYLVLWFWYAFLGPVSVLFVFYRLCTIFFGGIRFSLLYRSVSIWLLGFD